MKNYNNSKDYLYFSEIDRLDLISDWSTLVPRKLWNERAEILERWDRFETSPHKAGFPNRKFTRAMNMSARRVYNRIVEAVNG